VAVSTPRPEIDTVALKRRTDLLDLIGRDTRLRKVASTAGGEYAGPCPFCGGRDRFRVQPEQGRWWCRRCGDGARWEDAIAYVRKRDGVDFVEAGRLLGASERELESREAPQRHGLAWRRPGSILSERAEPPSPLAAELAADQIPTPAWQTAGLQQRVAFERLPCDPSSRPCPHGVTPLWAWRPHFRSSLPTSSLSWAKVGKVRRARSGRRPGRRWWRRRPLPPPGTAGRTRRAPSPPGSR